MLFLYIQATADHAGYEIFYVNLCFLQPEIFKADIIRLRDKVFSCEVTQKTLGLQSQEFVFKSEIRLKSP